MNQAVWQRLAEERIQDARTLLDGGRWEFAYYAAGYAVECALKSCVLARMIHTAWIFTEKWDAKECLTHEIRNLIALSGLKTELNEELKASAAAGGEFHLNWGIAEQWKVSSRYETRSEADAKALFAAVADEPNGVLRWIRKYW